MYPDQISRYSTHDEVYKPKNIWKLPPAVFAALFPIDRNFGNACI